MARALLETLRRHGVPQAYGFLNGAKLQAHPEDRAVLEAWVAAGQPLGNHTWAHGDLSRLPAAEFNASIDANEPLLRALQPQAPERTWRWFRYPFLHEGLELPVRDAVRAHLARRGYRIAQVTIDPYDWAYNVPYARCLLAGDTLRQEALRKAFLAEARAKLRWSVSQAQAVLGRPMRHVLLLHLGLLDADTLEQLLADYERLGVRWVTLEHAHEDPAYAQNPNVTYGGMFLFQLAEARGVLPPPRPLSPDALHETTCPEQPLP